LFCRKHYTQQATKSLKQHNVGCEVANNVNIGLQAKPLTSIASDLNYKEMFTD